jgi:hypothetical protein
MKTLFLATVAMLSLGAGAAFAESETQSGVNHVWRAMNGEYPTYVARPLTNSQNTFPIFNSTVKSTARAHANDAGG